MNRRQFLGACGTAAATVQASRAQANPLDRIAVLSWSFRDAFAKTRSKTGWVPPSGDLDIMDYPEMIADRYRLHNVEVQTMYLEPEPSFIKEFRQRLTRAHSKLVSIACEPEGEAIRGLGAPDEKARANAVAVNMKWIDYTAAIGSPILMINQGNLYDDLAPLTDSAKKLVEYGRSKKVIITAEPRGTSGRQPELLAKIMHDSGMRSTPDMGNLADDARDRGLRELIPMAGGTCHARYLPARFDLAQVMQLIKDLGYKGIYTIEAGFNGNPYDQVQLVLDQLVKYV